MKFYDNEITFEIFNLDMYGSDNHYPLQFRGKPIKGYIIYKIDGSLYRPQTKADLEKYFNQLITAIVKALKDQTLSAAPEK